MTFLSAYAARLWFARLRLLELVEEIGKLSVDLISGVAELAEFPCVYHQFLLRTAFLLARVIRDLMTALSLRCFAAQRSCLRW
jgi:hypothetical protein